MSLTYEVLFTIAGPVIVVLRGLERVFPLPGLLGET